MAGGAQDRNAERRPLVYPFGAPPDIGAAIEVAPGVLWARMPLGGPLNAINIWAIEEADGWTLVDTGMHTEAGIAAALNLLAGPLAGRPVTRVVVTHLHPDHVGMAGWFSERFGCRLWMSRLEYLQCRVLVSDTGREAPQDALDFYHAAGWDEHALAHYKDRFGWFGSMIHPLPDSFQRLSDGDELTIGGQVWRIVVGSGHSPEHACLYCPALKLMISGDQVLPGISSNVSVFPAEPNADPLADWLTSLARIKTLVPDDVLVLPAHNQPFRGLHRRIDQLIRGHERGLQRLQGALAQPKRAIDVFGALFARQIGPGLLGIATGESLSHLNRLIREGRATARADDQGVIWYSAVAT